jgi:alkanesulfonate monooxygenase SsuD/methylene tetrahydromethanopterin reductase-like flavin-dependent oxidoreductase (luciferase family)
MKLGLFMMPTHPPDKPTAQCYDEDVQLIRLADELGFSEAFIGEHATMAWENIPAPDQFIARVFPETTQIRLGTGVVLMPYHHPANTANRIAQLDHLTRGRINFGVGISGVVTDLEMFGVDPSDGRPGQMMMRAIDVILRLWTEDPPYDMPGPFWPIEVKSPKPETGLGRPLRPYQRPHPPIFIPGMAPQSRLMQTAGERGWNPMSTNFAHARVLAGHWEQYARGATSSGRAADRACWRISREVYVDETNEAARAFARQGALGRTYEDYWFRLMTRFDLATSDEGMPSSDVTIDYLLDNLWLVGDPEEVARRIRELYVRVGGFGTLLMVTLDWDDPERWQRSMRLLATEVMPRLADLT